VSTYCHRIVEFRNKDNQWVKCAEFLDNFHGFDEWKNKDYYGRGFPEGHTVDEKSLFDEETGKEFVWGKSYITLTELCSWAKQEREEALAYIFKELHYGLTRKMEGKLDDIYKVVVKKEDVQPVENGEDENDLYDLLGNYDYFKEVTEEAFDQYEMLHDELISAWSVVEPIKAEDEYWVESDRVRIVYYFE
jgi:hypothetical protein